MSKNPTQTNHEYLITLLSEDKVVSNKYDEIKSEEELKIELINTDSFAGAKELLCGRKIDIENSNFIKGFTETTEGSLKLTVPVLLLKHLSDKHKLDVSNCFLEQGQDELCFSSDPRKAPKIEIPKIKEIINHCMSCKKDINIIFKDLSSKHYSLFIYRHQNTEEAFYLLDSIGENMEVAFIVDCIKKHSSFSDKTYFITNSERTQFTTKNCSIFTYKNLKTILTNPEILEEIKDSVKNLSAHEVNIFDKLPAKMMKLFQSLPRFPENDPRKNEVIKEEKTLWECITTGKEGYGVKSFFMPENGRAQNKLADYLREKYLQKTIPTTIKEIGSTEEIAKLLDEHNFSEYSKQEESSKNIGTVIIGESHYSNDLDIQENNN